MNGGAAPGPAAPQPILEAELAARLAEVALTAIEREYPNKPGDVLRSDADAMVPRLRHPAFFGCFDWHSAVHSHWCLVRLLRLGAAGRATHEAQAVIGRHLSPENLATELAQMQQDPGFERPYGLAWLLQLAAELHRWPDPPADWLAPLAGLEALAAERLGAWIDGLRHPVRTGEHSQSAFAMSLFFDWARVCGDTTTAEHIGRRARAFYAADRDAPIAFEPSGNDFLSPSLAEADIMRRVLPGPEFSEWLTNFLPRLRSVDTWLVPSPSPDPADGKLAHLDGLSSSRAWMLAGVAAALAPEDPRRAALQRCAAIHLRAGLAAATHSAHYAGSHWLGSFAVYAATR